MFNLELAIAEWRRRMLAAGIKTPVPLDELENHLREEIDEQVRLGLGAEKALELAVQRIGQGGALHGEFRKNEWNSMKRRLIIGIGVVGLLLGTFMILPALGKHKERNRAALSAGESFFAIPWSGDERYGLMCGSALVLAGVSTALFSVKMRRSLRA